MRLTVNHAAFPHNDSSCSRQQTAEGLLCEVPDNANYKWLPINVGKPFIFACSLRSSYSRVFSPPRRSVLMEQSAVLSLQIKINI